MVEGGEKFRLLGSCQPRKFIRGLSFIIEIKEKGKIFIPVELCFQDKTEGPHGWRVNSVDRRDPPSKMYPTGESSSTFQKSLGMVSGFTHLKASYGRYCCMAQP